MLLHSPKEKERAGSVPPRNAPLFEHSTTTKLAAAAARSEQPRNLPVGETLSNVNVTEFNLLVKSLSIMLHNLKGAHTVGAFVDEAEGAQYSGALHGTNTSNDLKGAQLHGAFLP